MLRVFGTGRSANVMRGVFTSMRLSHMFRCMIPLVKIKVISVKNNWQLIDFNSTTHLPVNKKPFSSLLSLLSLSVSTSAFRFLSGFENSVFYLSVLLELRSAKQGNDQKVAFVSCDWYISIHFAKGKRSIPNKWVNYISRYHTSE